MSATIDLSYGEETITIAPPLWGYELDVLLALHAKELGTGQIRWFDDSETYDRRQLRASWLLDPTDHGELFEWCDNALKGRGNDFTLDCSSQLGFCPAGPDRGDHGASYTLHLLDYADSGRLRAPWGWYRTSLVFEVEPPAPVLPDEVDQGTWSVGTVTGLAEPQAGFEPDAGPAWHTEVTRDGTASTVDRGGGTLRATRFVQPCNIGKGAALLYYLVSTARGNAFAIDNTAGRVPFGQAVTQGSAVTARLRSPKLAVVHRGEQQFDIGMELVLESET